MRALSGRKDPGDDAWALWPGHVDGGRRCLDEWSVAGRTFHVIAEPTVVNYS